MLSYLNWSADQIDKEIQTLQEQLQKFIAMKLNLNMTRGKPCSEQLALSAGLHDSLGPQDYRAEDGTDCRNYGGLDGLPEARRLFAGLLGIKQEQVMVLGNSSLNLMYDMMVRCLLFALPGSEKSWQQQGRVRFLCPVPGYDRHFTVCASLGIEMIPVSMTADGPDMDQVEALAGADPLIKGMWAVPVYSNPDGITYSEETCRRLAAMRTAAPDFRLFWDNAYFMHHFNPDRPETTPEMLALCAAAGNANRTLTFASTSKVTWAGSGMACIAASQDNLDFIRRHMTAQTIGPDKMNQLRHVRFLRDQAGVASLMRLHAAILKPKFNLVANYLEEQLGPTGVCRWNNPGGGYFFSLMVLPGTATRVVALCQTCGVALTPAGSTWPYGRDPEDSNIRLAPSFPPLSELETAMQVICVCVRLAALDKLRTQAG